MELWGERLAARIDTLTRGARMSNAISHGSTVSPPFVNRATLVLGQVAPPADPTDSPAGGARGIIGGTPSPVAANLSANAGPTGPAPRGGRFASVAVGLVAMFGMAVVIE